MHAEITLLTVAFQNKPSEAARVLGISRMHLWRVMRRIESQAADPSPLRELRRRRSELAMSELGGSDLRNAVGVFGDELSLRR